MGEQMLFWLAPFGAGIALIFAYVFYSGMMEAGQGTPRSQEIAGYVKEGALAYMWAQYRISGMFFVFAFAFFAFLAFILRVQSPWTPIAFLTGGFFSALAGYLGLNAAMNTSTRTISAASKSLNGGLITAFRGSAVMGFVAVGLGLLDVSIWWKILTWVMSLKDTAFKDSIFAVRDYTEITAIMLTFGIGASAQALFSRVGGGIFAKAADLGASLVGKSEAGIPEDDPRNPAVIVDKIGDNVVDVVGTSADLYESFCISILATIALGASAFALPVLIKYQINAILLPMVVSGIGIIFSLVGVYFVNTHEEASPKDLIASMSKGINVAALLTAISSAVATYFLLPNHFHIYGSILTGLLVGVITGWSTEYFTSSDFEPTKAVAQQSTTGPAGLILEGLASGMFSTGIPTFAAAVGILFAYGFAGGYDTPTVGLYGIGMAAIGMLTTLGITLAMSAYGPIAGNASSNARMSQINPEVKKRIDILDALGNTSSAIGKGYTMGAMALAVIALLGAYIEELRSGLQRAAMFSPDKVDQFIFIEKKPILIQTANLHDFMAFFDVNLINPQVLFGILLGSMLVLVFCALTVNGVNRAAQLVVEEARRQFKEFPSLLKGDQETKPNYTSCVEVTTQATQKEMVIPTLLAIAAPLSVGLILGPSGVMGFLVGSLATGFVMAVFMANAGGAWEGAKKHIESGQFGGKGSDSHKAGIVGDIVGNLFKDALAPAVNNLIKLMCMVAIVIAGLTVSYSPEIQRILGFNPSEFRYKEDARRAFNEGTLKLPDHKPGIASATEDGVFDEEDPLMGSDDTILPEDEEGLLGDETASDTEEIGSSSTGTGEEPSTGKETSLSTGTGESSGRDFSGFDDGSKPTRQSQSTDTSTSEGFSGFDEPTTSPDKTENKPTDKSANKPAEVKPIDKPTDKPADVKPADKPVDKPVEAKPADKPTDTSTAKTGDKPSGSGFDDL